MIKNMKFKILFLLISFSLFLNVPVVSAAHFSCTANKNIQPDTARLQIQGPDVQNYLMAIVPLQSSQNPSPSMVSSHSETNQAPNLSTYVFFTDPSTTYRVLVLNSTSQLVEEIKSCQFKTPAVATPPVVTSDIKVTITVPANEKEAKVTILNNTDDPLYKITTTLSNSIGVNTVKSGNFDRVGGEIVQSFTDLTAKSDYFVTVKGERVSPASKVGNITKTYSFNTNTLKPGVVETSNTTTVPPPPNNPTNPTSGGNTSTTSTTNPNPTAYTIAGSGLSKEQIAADKKGNGLVPCKDTCDFNDLMQLINNIIEFLITTIFIPIIIILFMYAGFKYITAEGNPSKVANLKKMVGHIVLGMLIVLCSWLIVKTILTIISSNEVGVLQFLK
jgi:hypothetical protein